MGEPVTLRRHLWFAWSEPNYSLRERLDRTAELLGYAFVHHLPRRLAYWSYIDSSVRYTLPSEEVPAVTYAAILERFPREKL